MLQPKPITAALTNRHDKFYIIYRTNMMASLKQLNITPGQELNITTQRQEHIGINNNMNLNKTNSGSESSSESASERSAKSPSRQNESTFGEPEVSFDKSMVTFKAEAAFKGLLKSARKTLLTDSPVPYLADLRPKKVDSFVKKYLKRNGTPSNEHCRAHFKPSWPFSVALAKCSHCLQRKIRTRSCRGH